MKGYGDFSLRFIKKPKIPNFSGLRHVKKNSGGLKQKNKKSGHVRIHSRFLDA